jgi:hypothetical protein
MLPKNFSIHYFFDVALPLEISTSMAGRILRLQLTMDSNFTKTFMEKFSGKFSVMSPNSKAKKPSILHWSI